MKILELTPNDAPIYAALRREMLLDSPWAFTSSPEDDVGVRVGDMAARLAESGQAVVGAFRDEAGAERLIGAVGLRRNRAIKMAHRAHVWGVYVTPSARGAGVATRLMQRAIEIARSWVGVVSVDLSASVRSRAAIRLYERLGFVRWGLEPDAVMIDGVACDEAHMALDLRARSPGGA